jgi:predicted RNase H-like HicB family nuclease
MRKAYNILEGDDVMRKIHVNIFPEPNGGYFAEASALPGCFTQGESLLEVQRNMPEAVALMLGEESNDFVLSFELRKHEPRNPPDELELLPEVYTSLDDLLRDLKAG